MLQRDKEENRIRGFNEGGWEQGKGENLGSESQH